MNDLESYAAGRIPALRRAAYLLCGDWDRGDDLVQKVLTDLFSHWARVRRVENLDAYVHTMLVRRAIDERRSWWGRKVALTDADASPEVVAPPDADPTLRMDLAPAIRQLAPRQRAVIVLRYLQDLSVEETAVAMRCSTGTVKSQTARALVTLRRFLDITVPADAASEVRGGER